MKGISVLLVDSVASYRGSVASRLVEEGWDILEASGPTGVEHLVVEHAFDVAIVDFGLADDGAKTVVELLHGMPYVPKILAVVGSEQDVISSHDFCASLGVDKMVLGPVHPQDFIGYVRDLTDDRSISVVEAHERFSSLARPVAPAQSSVPAEDTYGIEEHLIVVRRSYQEKLPSELEKLEQLVMDAQANPDDSEVLQEAYRAAHTLHGTSGTLGFNEISTSTRQIEEVLKRMLGGTAPRAEDWDTIYKKLVQAKTAPERPSLMISAPPLRVANIATVLVVDSDRDTLARIDALGKQCLIQTVLAETHEQALVLASKKKLDGAIIDIDLQPEDSAFKVAQELRSIDGLDNLSIAFMANDSSLTNRVAAAHAGSSQFLDKPLTGESLQEAVRYFTAVKVTEKVRVLVVDDDEYFRSHIAAILEEDGMEVSSLGRPERILDVIKSFSPDILLLDVVMPKISGLDVCRMLRSMPEWNNLPILFLTAQSSTEARMECFISGGDDYIEKPVLKEELLARIGVRVERVRLFKERADMDMLTRLPNRRAFLQAFKMRVEEGTRYERPVSLCILDLDRFKYINDTYGHLAGDRVLAGLGKLLASRFRTVDIRGRWGGEEFAVAFYSEESETAKMILGRVLDEFKQMEFEGDEGQKFSVTFSGGIATYPKDGATFDELFRSADERLYYAKENGRAQVTINPTNKEETTSS